MKINLILIILILFSCNKENHECKKSRKELIKTKEEYQLKQDSITYLKLIDSNNLVHKNCQNGNIKTN